MKKLLFVLLIAVIFCSEIAEENEIELDFDELDAILQLGVGNWIEQKWDQVKHFFNSAVEFLKKHDLYDPIVTLLKRAAEQAAFILCKKKFEEKTCKSILDFLKGAIKDNKA